MAGDRLQDIFDRQVSLQREAYGLDMEALAAREISEVRIQQIKNNVLALTDELHEALNEAGWKPWATSRHVNERAFQGEIVDALHFLINLYVLGGGTPDTLYDQYREKNDKNRKRQQDGYDGIQGKCPGCKRALDDVGVSCQQIYSNEGAYIECDTTQSKYWV